MHSLDDTIAGISTPLGEAGIGIVRLSGPEVLSIAGKIFRPAGSERMESHRLHHGYIVDPQTAEQVDEVLVSFMQAPHSYTRQDVLEINCHGGIVPVRRVLELTLRYGARLAEPGEMTLRAFLLGRIDLAQAEAVLDIVRAKSEASLRAAMQQLSGRLSDRVREVRRRLLGVLAYLEATIDFEEDEIPPQDIAPAIGRAEEEVKALITSADRGMVLRQGVRVAIVGRPNVGKSSLLNALLRASRAIVTPIPGTTRDTIEETVILEGVPVSLIDTAGITQSQSLVERLGVERSRETIQSSDLVLMVIDASESLNDEDHRIKDLLNARPTILVINKIDLPLVTRVEGFLPNMPQVMVSALTGQGLGDLEQAITEGILAGKAIASNEALVTNPRHKAALTRALAGIAACQEAREAGLPADFVTVDLRRAVDALGEITGETASDELLQIIFSQFCIGK